MTTIIIILSAIVLWLAVDNALLRKEIDNSDTD